MAWPALALWAVAGAAVPAVPTAPLPTHLPAPWSTPLFEQARRPLRHVTPPPQIASLSAEACGLCHATQYRQWLGSRHAQAFTNRIFVASYRREPMRWCRNCHAPLPEQAHALTEEGINCAACHVRDGAVLGSTTPTDKALAAHPVRVTGALRDPDFCGGCHQFNFPRDGAAVRYTDQPMQDTVAEWRRTGAKDTCQSCHMAAGSHGFPGGHDADWMRATVRATARQLPEGKVAVELRASGVGHRMPTGDPFRRLVVDLCADEPCAEPLYSVTFGRRFRRKGDGWTLVRDSTLPAPGSAVGGPQATRTIEVALLGGRQVRTWRLRYAYAAPSTEGDLAGSDVAIELSSGPVAP